MRRQGQPQLGWREVNDQGNEHVLEPKIPGVKSRLERRGRYFREICDQRKRTMEKQHDRRAEDRTGRDVGVDDASDL
eukprot:511343-Hanusia_phi.AAC.1